MIAAVATASMPPTPVVLHPAGTDASILDRRAWTMTTGRSTKRSAFTRLKWETGLATKRAMRRSVVRIQNE